MPAVKIASLRMKALKPSAAVLQVTEPCSGKQTASSSLINKVPALYWIISVLFFSKHFKHFFFYFTLPNSLVTFHITFLQLISYKT